MQHCVFAASTALSSRALLLSGWLLNITKPSWGPARAFPAAQDPSALCLSQHPSDGHPIFPGDQAKRSSCARGNWRLLHDMHYSPLCPPFVLLQRLLLSTCSEQILSLAENQDCSSVQFGFIFWQQHINYFVMNPRCNNKLHTEICAFLFFNFYNFCCVMEKLHDFIFFRENKHFSS